MEPDGPKEETKKEVRDEWEEDSVEFVAGHVYSTVNKSTCEFSIFSFCYFNINSC